jgi:HD-GYP domain-containing protein (c-di-GMP phosphodiesterase class II)
VPDVQADPDYLKGWPSARSELVLPLKSGERIIGALDLQSSEPAAFREDEVRVLSQFASRASLMLDHARLVSETEQHMHRLSALHTVDIAVASSLDLQVTLKVFLEQVTSHLRVDAADVLLLNPHLQVLEYAAGRGFRGTGMRRVNLRVGEDVGGQAALERRFVGVVDFESLQEQAIHPERISGEGFVSEYAVPLIARGKMKGVLELYFRNRFVADTEWQNFVETLARQAAVAIDDANLFEQLQRSYTELAIAYDSTIEGWARLLELRNLEPSGHGHQVSAMVMELARRMNVPDQDLTHIHRGVLLHDIGKLAIPDKILLKPGPLTDAEWTVIRTHPVIARDLLVSIDYLRPAAVIPYAHHEKWDGSGYPRGLKAEQIPLVARIFSVADVWDTLKREQPHRPAWSEADATDFIRTRSGLDFDPLVVDAFLVFIEGRENRTPFGDDKI